MAVGVASGPGAPHVQKTDPPGSLKHPRLNGDELRENANTFEQLVPYLMSQGAMLDALTSVGALDRLDVQPASDQSRLLSDRLYLQMMGWRANGLEDVLAEVETVDQSIEHILELLDGPREGSGARGVSR